MVHCHGHEEGSDTGQDKAPAKISWTKKEEMKHAMGQHTSLLQADCLGISQPLPCPCHMDPVCPMTEDALLQHGPPNAAGFIDHKVAQSNVHRAHLEKAIW